MKLKRFLALAVSAIMVLTMVPAMSVSAAVGDTVTYNGTTYTVIGENLVPDGGFEDADGNFSWGTWFSPNGTNGPFANKCEDWFYKVNRDTNAAVLYTKSLDADDYALGTRWNDGSTGLCSLANNIAVEAGKTYHIGFDYKHKTNNVDPGYMWVSFVETATTSTDGPSKIVNMANATTSWQTASSVYTPEQDGYIFFHFRWLGDGSNTGNGPFWYLDNFVVEEVKLPEASTEGTIKAALDGISLPLATKADLAMPTIATDSIGTTVDVAWTSSNTDVVANNGTVTSPAEITTVTMTPSTVFNGATVTGNDKNVVVFPASVAGTEWHGENGVYTIGTENIIAAAGTAASFEDADGNQSLAGWKSHLGGDTNGAMNWVDASVDVVPDGNWAYAGWWNDPITHASNYCTIDTMWAVEAGTYYLSFYAKKPAGGSETWVYFSEDDVHHTAVNQITSEAWFEAVAPTADWAKYEYVITAPTAGYIGFTSHNIGNNGSRGTQFDDFELYTAVQAEEALASVPAVTAATTVIAGNTPILPTTVVGTGTLGSNMEVAVEWNTTDIDFTQVGTITVPGTVTGTEFTTSATVEVLAETFALADTASNNAVYFPVPIYDEFTLEFDLVATNYDNAWIYIGADAALWGAGQIGLGWDDAGNGYFRAQPAAQTNVQFETGVTYRFLVTGDASTDTYDLVVTNPAGEKIIVVNDYAFRSASEYVNSINMTPNGQGGAWTISNVKVNSTVAKTEYTFVVNVNGIRESLDTKSFWTLDEATASIEDREGHEKTVTVDGTTITVDYSSVYTATATFLAEDGHTVKYVSTEVVKGESYAVQQEEVFVICETDNCGHFYVIPYTEITEDNNNLSITVHDVAGKYAVKEDALVDKDNNIWGIKNTNSNSVFVAGTNSGPANDANGEALYEEFAANLGSQRTGFVQFPVVDLEEGQKATANFYVRTWHAQTWTHNSVTNDRIRLTATVINDDSWTELADGAVYAANDAPVFEGYTDYIFSDWATKDNAWVTFDVTEAMMAAKAANLETITLKLNIHFGAAYIAEREACVVGGQYEGKAAYIEVSDAGLVKVTETGDAVLTKNGSAMNGFAYVASTDDVRLNAADAVVIGTDAGYYEANKNLNLTEATTFANTAPAGLGLEMVGGAQVRIGSANLEEGDKIDALADSGIRFLAKADYADTVLDDAVEFGIKVSAEASENVAYIPAVSFQNDDNSVFSAAITSLKESNYNRKYTAVAYAKVPMADGSVKEFVTDGVTRSIYQVSAGIMKNGTADAENAAYTVEGVVKNVLNAYVNQTGIRLGYDGTTMTVEEGKYTGDVFFTVTSEAIEGGVRVTITPDTTWGTPAEIATWWTDYVRVNNNNSIAKTYIKNAQFVDGVLTFDFMYVG